MGGDDWRQAHLELTDAHERRDAIIAEQTARLEACKTEARSRLRVDAIAERSRSLSDRRYAIWTMIVQMPVWNIRDLAEKLAFIERHDDDPTEFEFAAVAADIKRIAGGVA